jgi:hypothetical protein
MLRRGAERWHRSAEKRPELDNDSPPEEVEAGRHRAQLGPPLPWRPRPRARLDGSLHRAWLTAVFLVVVLLCGGADSAITSPSLGARAVGVLAFVCGAVLVLLAVLYLRRPVER